MGKPIGKQSVKSAVEFLYPIMPIRFSSISLHILVCRRIGRPHLFHDTTIRKLRELREEGSANFKNIDRAKSIYLKLENNIKS